MEGGGRTISATVGDEEEGAQEGASRHNDQYGQLGAKRLTLQKITKEKHTPPS